MTSRKKRNSSRAPQRDRGDSQPAGGERQHAKAASPSRWSRWKTGALCLITAAIVLLVFAPWLQRYIEGQFFGMTGDYGTDFFRYSQGSMAAIRLGVDPYSNEQMFGVLQEGRLQTDHPNPFYDDQMANKSFAASPEPIAKGVVSPPFLLVMIYPLVALLGYTLALNVWTVAGLLGISWLSVQFWRKLIPPASRWRRLASCGAMLSLLVLSGFPVLWSAIYGQFEVIYFFALGGAMYLWSFQRNGRTTPLLVGLLLAIGGAVKVFPLLMLGYFLWQAFWSYKNSPNKRPFFASLTALPEAQACFFGIAFFAAISLLTGIVLGFDVYLSFLGKVADLEVEGTGPSMKGNLLSYLNFLPVWWSGPFTPMTGSLQFLYAPIAAAVVVAIALSTRGTTTPMPDAPRDSLTTLLDMTLVLAALPTILPHWWIYYNVVLILPLMACFIAAKKTRDRRSGRWIMALTASSFVLTFSYLTTSVFFGAFPGVYDLLINRDAVDAALAKAAAEPALLENLPYSAASGEPYAAEFEGRVVSPFNLLYGVSGGLFVC